MKTSNKNTAAENTNVIPAKRTKGKGVNPFIAAIKKHKQSIEKTQGQIDRLKARIETKRKEIRDMEEFLKTHK